MCELSLRLNKFDSLVLRSSDILISEVYLCYELELYYKNKKTEILAGVTAAGTFAEQFIKSLSLAIEQKLTLDESIVQNLGYYWNEILADRKDKLALVSEDYGEFVDWVGLKHYLFGSYADSDLYVSTWLYNDKDGNIIFEVTELFKWSVKETYSEQDPEFLEYLEFLKDYKSITKVIITPGYAKDLLKNIQTLYKLFQQNEQK